MHFLQQLTRAHVLAVGCVLFVAISAIVHFSLIKPELDIMGQERRRTEDYRARTTELQPGLVKLAEAEKDYLRQRAAYDRLIAKQPKIDTKDGNQAAFDLWREYGNDPNSFGNSMWRWLRQHGQSPRGIQVPGIPLPPVAVPPLISIGMGGFGITAKSFPDTLSFIRKLHEMPRVVMLGNRVSMGGISPYVDVALPITAFIITKNAIGGATVATGTPTAAGFPGPGTGGAWGLRGPPVEEQ
jgi:hypothetical protein